MNQPGLPAAVDASRAIKSMKLYYHVERIYNELRALGIGDGEPLDVGQLTAWDQFHYQGTEAVREAVERLKIGPDQRVLEIGSGIGGPARYLAHISGCRVTALELQPDLHATAADLTRRCGLADRVEHRCGDILRDGAGLRDFDAVTSWLTFLHIPDRTTLLARCHDALRGGGGIYIEDFSQRRAFTPAERADLASKIYCTYLPTAAEYAAQLAVAGFANIEITDMTAEWTRFVADRRAAFEAARPRNVALHGADIVDALGDFYATVDGLYRGGNLGGVRIVARRA